MNLKKKIAWEQIGGVTSSKQELNQEVVKLSVQMAEKILLRELKDRKAQSDYVETLLKDNSLS